LALTALALFCLSLFEEKPKISDKETRVRGEMKKPLGKKSPGILVGKADNQRGRESVIPHIKESRQVAILIDDIGQDLEALRDLLAIDAPLSFAVLPHLAHSAEADRTLHRSAREILLHLPMEPQSFPRERPGEGALFLSMSDHEIRKQFQENLNAVPHAKGVNNHMGSRFTEDENKMAVVMTMLKGKGLYFVDSRTTKDSKAREVADRIGVKFLARKIFIDNDQTYEASLHNLTRLLQDPGIKAGHPVLFIGHPYPSTILAIRDAVPILRAKGIEIVPVSKILGH
jgi:polysaccharide deacetylase 2 family uncharacterized protein YibQ